VYYKLEGERERVDAHTLSVPDRSMLIKEIVTTNIPTKRKKKRKGCGVYIHVLPICQGRMNKHKTKHRWWWVVSKENEKKDHSDSSIKISV